MVNDRPSYRTQREDEQLSNMDLIRIDHDIKSIS
jgi:hypothetical protein